MKNLGKKIPSVKIDNGTGNSVEPGRGQTALGVGVKARGEKQTVIGSYNTESTDDKFQIGVGTSDEDRANVSVVDKYGVAKTHRVYIESNGVLVPVYLTLRDNYEEVLLKL